MSTDEWDGIADHLDDLQRIVDEQLERLPAGVRRETVNRLSDALQDARDAADDIEDEKR
jgi:hypothetical protein